MPLPGEPACRRRCRRPPAVRPEPRLRTSIRPALLPSPTMYSAISPRVALSVTPVGHSASSQGCSPTATPVSPVSWPTAAPRQGFVTGGAELSHNRRGIPQDRGWHWRGSPPPSHHLILWASVKSTPKIKEKESNNNKKKKNSTRYLFFLKENLKLVIQKNKQTLLTTHYIVRTKPSQRQSRGKRQLKVDCFRQLDRGQMCSKIPGVSEMIGFICLA